MRLVTQQDRIPLRQNEWESYLSQNLSFVTNDRRVSYEWESIKAAIRERDNSHKSWPRLSCPEAPTISYRHFLPYNIIRHAVMAYINDSGGTDHDAPTLREVGQCLEKAVINLYSNCVTFPLSKLRAPGDCPAYPVDDNAGDPEWGVRGPDGPCPERTRSPLTDRQGCSHCILWTSVETSRKRYAAMAWFSWAIEAICDYPDNIYYGRGTGDGGGDLVDLPLGLVQSNPGEWHDTEDQEVNTVQVQSVCVRLGAMKLLQCLKTTRHVRDPTWPISLVLPGFVDEDGIPGRVYINERNNLAEYTLQGVPLQAWKVITDKIFFIDLGMVLSNYLGDDSSSDNPLKKLYFHWREQFSSIPSWKQSRHLCTALMVAQQIFEDNGVALSIREISSCATRICEVYNTWCGTLSRIPTWEESEEFIKRLRSELEFLKIVAKDLEQISRSAFAPSSSEFEIEALVFGSAL